MAKLLFIFLFFSFSFGLTTQGRSVEKCHMSQNRCHSNDVTQIKSHNNHRKVVYRPCNNCISSVQEIHKNSIKFFLLNIDKGSVGFIPAQKLAILTLELDSITSRHRSS